MSIKGHFRFNCVLRNILKYFCKKSWLQKRKMYSSCTLRPVLCSWNHLHHDLMHIANVYMYTHYNKWWQRTVLYINLRFFCEVATRGLWKCLSPSGQESKNWQCQHLHSSPVGSWTSPGRVSAIKYSSKSDQADVEIRGKHSFPIFPCNIGHSDTHCPHHLLLLTVPEVGEEGYLCSPEVPDVSSFLLW